MDNSIIWTLNDSPNEDAWQQCLSPQEREKFADLRFPKRQRDWLLGRWTAKELLLKHPELHNRYQAQELTIANREQGAPYVLLPQKQELPGCLSISHSHNRAFCAYTPNSALSIGADLEKIEAHPQYFIEDYFTPFEIEQYLGMTKERHPLYSTLFWSSKEAVLKALHQGLHRDTREVELDLTSIEPTAWFEGRWLEGRVKLPVIEGRGWQLWLQRHDDFVLTIAALYPSGTTSLNPIILTPLVA